MAGTRAAGPDPAGGGLLANARAQAEARGLLDLTVVDVDSHHRDMLRELMPFVAEPWRRQLAPADASNYRILPGSLGDPWLGGVLRRGAAGDEPAGSFPELAAARAQLGIDVAVVLPTNMMSLGANPRSEYEPVLAEAYARWMTERVLPGEPAVRSLLYLPLSDPDACLELIARFGEARGVAGFVLTTVRYQQIHQNRFMPVYAALEERGLVLGFHPAYPWQEGPLEVFNKFSSAYAYGVPLFNFVQLTNLVVNGVLERFPRLRCVFFEAGLSWLPFICHRLDNEYMMRTSEAPLLRRLPSEYVRDCYFSTQPLEWLPEEALEALFSLVDTSHLLYASNYPRMDFDTPARIYDLPFLSPDDKRGILGGNAARLLGLDRAGGRVASDAGRNGGGER